MAWISVETPVCISIVKLIYSQRGNGDMLKRKASYLCDNECIFICRDALAGFGAIRMPQQGFGQAIRGDAAEYWFN